MTGKQFTRIPVYILIAAVGLSACGPKATEAPVATEAPADYPAATEAPEMESSADWLALEAGAQPQSFINPQKGKPEYDRDEPEDMFFDDYGVNPFVETEEDDLSTFALDVDTGSYTIMRSYIEDGYLPPEDAIRVEEFINYFDQGYAYPSERRVFAIHIDGGSTPFTQTEGYQMLRVGIQGYAVPDYERKDVSLTFVIDVSGSMDMDNRLGLVKQSLEMLVEQLGRNDRVSIVVYGSNARAVLNPTPGNQSGEIMEAIYSLEPEGSTNAEAGLVMGYRMALKQFNPEGINRVILCSDGVANVGATGPGSIWESIDQYASEGITLTTIGFGMDNYNDVLMEQLADNGDGFYAYVDDIPEARRLFVENLTSTLQVIAMDAKVQIEFNPALVSRYRLVGFENRHIADKDFRDNSVDAGEIGAGHSVTALYEVKLYPEARGEIAVIHMRWEDPDTREVVEISQDFKSNELVDHFYETDPHFQWDVVVAEYAEILRNSGWAEDSSLEEVYEQARRISRSLPEDQAVDEFVELVWKASNLLDGWDW
ncbi:MAG: von Willebrand factor type A domain-containing protein [Anaerolineales bacterium]|nr:von Willebrand factor type A domain-containing protein [Anaerolineales bacterium]